AAGSISMASSVGSADSVMAGASLSAAVPPDMLQPERPSIARATTEQAARAARVLRVEDRIGSLLRQAATSWAVARDSRPSTDRIGTDGDQSHPRTAANH